MKVTVAFIGKPQGLKGEVSLDLRTDIPEERLSPGSVLETNPANAGPLTVATSRTSSGRWYVGFATVSDRNGAEELRGVELIADADDADEDDAWYVHELVGLRVERPNGEVLGKVTDLLNMPAQDLLEIRQNDGVKALIPLVEEFVPEVDIEGGRVIVTPPYGLLSGEQPVISEETTGDAPESDKPA
jgi:16S rRNA processing protein RimM